MIKKFIFELFRKWLNKFALCILQINNLLSLREIVFMNFNGFKYGKCLSIKVFLLIGMFKVTCINKWEKKMYIIKIYLLHLSAYENGANTAAELRKQITNKSFHIYSSRGHLHLIWKFEMCSGTTFKLFNIFLFKPINRNVFWKICMMP